ncbi:MAG: hypothetical protein ACJ8DI_31400 [Ktedonobacteraceae bacterium]
MDQISSQTSPAPFEQKCIYNQPGDPEKAGIIFPASNEFDWAWFPWTPEPVDVIIGFGTNASWDVAIRHRTKTLILGDWQREPLLGQEYLLRPFILLAKNRQEFLSFLSGIPVPQDAKASVDKKTVLVGDGGATSESLVPTWVYLGGEEQKLRRDKGGFRQDMMKWKPGQSWKASNPSAPTQKQVEEFSTLYTRMDGFQQEILSRVKADQRFDNLHLQYVTSYLQELRNYTLANVRREPNKPLVPTKQPDPDTFGPFRGKEMGDNGNLWLSFQNRYSPNKVLGTAKQMQKAVPEQTIWENINKEDFSCLSSETSFQSLKRLFENVQYVLGSMYDAQMYQAIKQRIGGSSYLIFGSNIVDVTTFVPEERTKNRESFLREAAQYLATQDTPLRFQQTTNPQMSHGTEDFLISDKGAIQVLSSYPPK